MGKAARARVEATLVHRNLRSFPDDKVASGMWLPNSELRFPASSASVVWAKKCAQNLRVQLLIRVLGERLWHWVSTFSSLPTGWDGSHQNNPGSHLLKMAEL